MVVVSKIKDLMQEQGLTLKDLEQRTGLSNETINRARGERILKCRVETLQTIATALGVKVTDLFEEKD